MPRPTTTFACSACGHESARWHGQCPGCGAWNTLVEEARAPAVAGGRGGGRGRGSPGVAARPIRLAAVRTEQLPRLCTGLGELDRVLGGGLVPGSIVLLGG